MRKIKNALLVLLLFHTAHSFGQWTEISNIENRFIHTLSFLDDDLGYALMFDNTNNAASVMKTVDGGTNWNAIDLPLPTGEFQDVCFYAEGEGVVVVRDLSNEVVPTKVFRTTDDGLNWEDISPETTAKGVGVGRCQFLNPAIGFLVTDRFFYKTVDGGEHWVSENFEDYVLSIDFLDADHGVLGTWNNSFSYKGGMLSTHDGGVTWTNYSLDENYSSIMEVRQISNDVAIAAPVYSWAAIFAGPFYKTTDGGINWEVVEIPTPSDDHALRQIDFKDEMNGVVCVGDLTTTLIYQTTDGGQSWEEEGTITSVSDVDMQLTPNNGYIGGKVGSFYKRSGTTSTKEALTKVDIRIYPSPAKSGQVITWDSPQEFTSLLVVDPTGTIVHRQRLNQHQAALPQLASGLYVVQLRNRSSFATAKLVVE